MAIPQFDLRPVADALGEPLLERWRSIIERTAFVGGDEVGELESSFASTAGTAGCVGVANGTDALTVSLRALGLAPGDEVIVPSFTFFATAEAVVLAGGHPVFADVDMASLTINPAEIDRVATSRTVGVIGVHLYGQPCDLDALGERCQRRGWWLVEDAAQAHGASWRGRPVGSHGRLAAWSFYPSKNLGCFGDGGAVTGPDADLLAKVRSIANHGRISHYDHGVVGTNSRLDALQAAVLNLRLPQLEADNVRRRAIAARYREVLTGVGDLRFVEEPAESVCVYHQVTVRTARRDALGAHLGGCEIGYGIYYPKPLHRLEAMRPYVGGDVELPVSDEAAATVLSLPIFPQLDDEAVEVVCDGVRSFY